DDTVVAWKRPHFKPGTERRVEVGRGAGHTGLGRLPIGCLVARSDEVRVFGPNLATQQVLGPTLQQSCSSPVDSPKLPLLIERHHAVRDVIEYLKIFHALAPPSPVLRSHYMS